MHEQKINKAYNRELFGSMFIYVVVLFITIWIAKGMEDGVARTSLVMLPMIPVLGAFWAIVRHFRRMDEYIRVWTLEVIAISGGITAIFALSYGFLEGVGFPKLTMFVIWCIFMGSWAILGCGRKWWESRNEE
jgi:hypothetical protein